MRREDKIKKTFHDRKTKRRKILDKTNGKCKYCGKKILINTNDKSKRMTVDHYIPISKGGEDNFDNSVPACNDCNCRKMDMLPEEFMEKLKMEN